MRFWVAFLASFHAGATHWGGYYGWWFRYGDGVGIGFLIEDGRGLFRLLLVLRDLCIFFCHDTFDFLTRRFLILYRHKVFLHDYDWIQWFFRILLFIWRTPVEWFLFWARLPLEANRFKLWPLVLLRREGEPGNWQCLLGHRYVLKHIAVKNSCPIVEHLTAKSRLFRRTVSNDFRYEARRRFFLLLSRR